MTAPNVTTPGEVGTGRAPGQEQESSDIIASASFCSNPRAFPLAGKPQKFPLHPERIVERKAEANMEARAALAGCELHSLADGQFLLTRWGGLSRACPDLRSVSALLDQIGGA